jgi:hypothetical protein
MQRVGLEWLYRLAQEPSRMWRRYLFGNAAFARLILEELLSRTRLAGLVRGDSANGPSAKGKR